MTERATSSSTCSRCRSSSRPILGVLLRYSKLLKATDGDLTLVTDDARIMRVIEITGLSSHFRFERTLSDAIDSAIEAAYT